MDTRDAIWLALLNSARWERYYGILTTRFRRQEMVVRSVPARLRDRIPSRHSSPTFQKLSGSCVGSWSARR